MADLTQANKLLLIARRLSNSAGVERDIARQKFWDAVDESPDELMLVGGNRADHLDREPELLRLQAERDRFQMENAALRQTSIAQEREIDSLRRNQTAQSDDEAFEQLLRENGLLRRERDQMRAELRFRDEVPRPPPVPRRS